MTEDERRVEEFVESIERDLIRVLEHRTQMSDEPRYSQHIAVHAVVDLAGRLMLSLIAQDASAAPMLTAMVDRLRLLIEPVEHAH